MALVKYRIHVFDTEDAYELFADRRMFLALDLDTPQGFKDAQIDLENLRLALASRANMTARERSRVRLEVRKPDSERVELDWFGQ